MFFPCPSKTIICPILFDFKGINQFVRNLKSCVSCYSTLFKAVFVISIGLAVTSSCIVFACAGLLSHKCVCSERYRYISYTDFIFLDFDITLTITFFFTREGSVPHQPGLHLGGAFPPLEIILCASYEAKTNNNYAKDNKKYTCMYTAIIVLVT